jgi:hypothetical protein
MEPHLTGCGGILPTASDLDDLVQAMAHWLEAAEARSSDHDASLRALAEAHRRWQAHLEQVLVAPQT